MDSYEDSNFGGLRIPHVYTYMSMHKWLKHLASATSGIQILGFHVTS